MKIYDTFIFGSDLDMLECRLRELDQSPVYRHVIVEAPFTHQGQPKPLCYAENAERFAPWKDRITHVVAEVPGPSKYLDPWIREHAQRSYVYQGLKDAEPEDIVWLCDVDEIPSQRMWTHEPFTMTAWNMRLAMFAVDWVYPEPTRIAISGRFFHCTNLGRQRDNGYRGGLPLAEDAGWHFTWLGGPDGIRAKLRQQCHLELAALIEQGLENKFWWERGLTWHGQAIYPPQLTRLHQQLPAVVDETWPVYIRDRLCPPEWFRPHACSACGTLFTQADGGCRECCDPVWPEHQGSV